MPGLCIPSPRQKVPLPVPNVVSPLAAMYGRGVGRIHFYFPTFDFSGAGTHHRNDFMHGHGTAADVILWNADHTEAKIGISVYYNGLAGQGGDMRLRKFGDTWVVIEAKQIFIS